MYVFSVGATFCGIWTRERAPHSAKNALPVSIRDGDRDLSYWFEFPS